MSVVQELESAPAQLAEPPQRKALPESGSHERDDLEHFQRLPAAANSSERRVWEGVIGYYRLKERQNGRLEVFAELDSPDTPMEYSAKLGDGPQQEKAPEREHTRMREAAMTIYADVLRKHPDLKAKADAMLRQRQAENPPAPAPRPSTPRQITIYDSEG
jgi:hypothetical protein